MMRVFGLLLMQLCALSFIQAQSLAHLKEDILEVLKDKKATVGVAITGSSPQDTISVNGDRHLPMQSVFKFHLAMSVLNQVDQGKLNLNDSIYIDQATIDTYSHLWGALRKKYPNGGKVTIAEMIQYTVALSDNLGCDLLFEQIGGVDALSSYLGSIGIVDIAIRHNELVMQSKVG